MRVQHRVRGNRIERWQADHAACRDLRVLHLSDETHDLHADPLSGSRGTSGVIAYGIRMRDARGPGESRCVESISTQSAGRVIAHEYGAADIRDRLDRFAGRKPMRDFDDRAFAHCRTTSMSAFASSRTERRTFSDQ